MSKWHCARGIASAMLSALLAVQAGAAETGAAPGAERVAEQETSQQAQDTPVRIGGALRFNVVHRNFDDISRGKRGETGLDLLRLNIEGELDNVLIAAEYRFYSYMQTLRYGWIGYAFEDDSEVHVGVAQVPFGLQPFDANNSWFGVPYYVGLADNYDMGVRYQRQDGPWLTHLAFFKNEEFNDPTDLDRYAFDLVVDDDPDGLGRNEEIDRLNARLAHVFGQGGFCETEVGVSGQYASLYNRDTRRRGEHWAAAAHVDARCGRWALQVQGIHYDYAPANRAGVSRDTVRLGAFGASYDIAARADILTTNVAYNVDPPVEWMDQLICYNDYSRLFKRLDGARDSQINTIGCGIGSGPLFTYVDYIFANNMAFFGDGSMADGGSDRWRGRLNINIGFYW